MTRSFHLQRLFAIALAALWLAGGGESLAATFTVNSTVDEADANPGDALCATVGGACTLRAAVEEANTTSAATVQLPAGTFTTGAPLTITTNLTVIGADRATTIVQGGGFSIVVTDCGGADVGLMLESTTVASGGISASGCTVHVVINNALIGPGGGVKVSGFMAELTITDSIVSGNSSGGIEAGRCFVTVVRSLISSNTSLTDGAGLHSSHSDSRVRITDSVFRDNHTAGDGGALFARVATIVGSLLEDNDAEGRGGAIAISVGDVTMTDTTVRRNHSLGGDGGALTVGLGSASITTSTIADNEAMNGGGLDVSSASTIITASTFSDNRALTTGGAINAYGGTLAVTASTVTDNVADSDDDGIGDGGGIYQAGTATSHERTILAGNTDNGGEANTCLSEFGGSITSLGHNLIDDLTGCALATDPTDLVGVDPLLGPLTDNGGPTFTRALLSGSPAIEAGGSCTDTDQRGVTRPQGSACDIGAYEFACGNGVVDLGETCDDGNTVDGDCCSANCRIEQAGTVCREASGECDVPETCNGSDATCPKDAFAAILTTCTRDGNVCTSDECDGDGACIHPPGHAGFVCRSADGGCDIAETCTGVDADCPMDVNPPCPGSTETPHPTRTPSPSVTPTTLETAITTPTSTSTGTLTPTPTEAATPTPLPICAPTPQAGCKTPSVAQKSTLTIKDRVLDKNDFLDWHWIKGSPTSKSEFGAPDVTTDYVLCVYDTGPPRHLVLTANVPGGQMCGARRPKPCWKATKTGFHYHDAAGAADGVRSILLQEGLEAGKAKIVLSCKGGPLDVPNLLSMVPPLTVQFSNSEGKCWEAVYSVPGTFEASTFKGKADPTPRPRPTHTHR